MVYLKHSEISLIENFVAWPRGPGYVLRFSDNTFAEFFKDEFQIEIYDSSYQDQPGTSKRHHLISFCLKEPAGIVARVLSMLADNRRQLADASPSPPQDGLQDPFEALVATIETRADQPLTDALYLYAQDRSLGELVTDLQRTLEKDKPEAALDRLHTYCMKYFAYLLSQRSIKCTDKEALHARFGKYRNCLLAETNLQEISDLAMKSAISVLEKFNDVRNSRSFAHDSVILEHQEARYVFDIVTALLRFIHSYEAGRF